jgi:uncharacterized protein
LTHAVRPLQSLPRLLFVFFLLPLAVCAQSRQPAHSSPASIDGDWNGALQVGDDTLHLVLHLSRASGGALKATLDSLEQGVYGMVVPSVSYHAPALSLSIPAVGASFEGKLAMNHRSIQGTWTQGGAALPLMFARRALGASRLPVDAVAGSEGLWQGALLSGGLRLRLQLHVSHDANKNLVVSLDSLDQGVSGVPGINVAQKGTAFHFEIPSVGGSYDGALSATKNLLTGAWTQGGIAQKLDFRRSDRIPELRRPQTPSKPYPYREEEVTIQNAAAQIALAGTLTVPRGEGPFPSVLLVAGTGPLDRNEEDSGHQAFLVLADHLTRQGIAVLRYDKRGVAKSSGDYESATTQDLAADAKAALAFLKSRKEAAAGKVGMIGHSEGGLIAAMLAAHSKDVAWLILLSAPATKGEDTLLNQARLIAQTAGVNEAQLNHSLDFDRKSYALIREQKDRATLEEKLSDLVTASGMSTGAVSPALQGQIHYLSSPWFRFFLDYDPVPALEKLTCPVLVLSGERDLQVPPASNLPLIREALEAAGNKDFQVTELPGLNHSFQHAPTGLPTESRAIEETFAPEALRAISSWILKHSDSSQSERHE